MEVQEGQANDEFPMETCPKCTERFAASGLLDSISQVKWRMLNASTYKLEEVVSFT